MSFQRTIYLHRHYFKSAYRQLNRKEREKIQYVMEAIISLVRIPSKFIKQVEGEKGLYEIKLGSGGMSYRIFCCFSGQNEDVLLNMITKKDQKLKRNEIEKAKKLKSTYDTEKKGKARQG